MRKHRRLALFGALAVFVTTPALAGDLKLSMDGGRVTLIAQEVPLRQILTEWSRIGRTQIVNADKLAGPPLTLQLVDVPERQALDILLRSASGYVAAQRAVAEPGASVFDRVMILPTSRAPTQSVSAPPPPAFNRPMMAQPMPADEDEEQADTPVMPPGAVPPQGGVGAPPYGQPSMPQSAPGMPVVRPGTQPVGMQPQAFPQGSQPAADPNAPPVLTAPRPGMLPAPQQPATGRGGLPGAVRPGAPGGPGGGK